MSNTTGTVRRASFRRRRHFDAQPRVFQHPPRHASENLYPPRVNVVQRNVRERQRVGVLNQPVNDFRRGGAPPADEGQLEGQDTSPLNFCVLGKTPPMRVKLFPSSRA
jgi:hypothetical protein